MAEKAEVQGSCSRISDPEEAGALLGSWLKKLSARLSRSWSRLDRDSREDAVSTALLAGYEAVASGRLNSPDTIGGYLTVAALRAANRNWSGQQRTRSVASLHPAGQQNSCSPWDLRAPVDPCADQAVSRHVLSSLVRGLARLAPVQQTALLLRALGATYEEISRITERPEETVRSQVCRARTLLRPLLAD